MTSTVFMYPKIYICPSTCATMKTFLMRSHFPNYHLINALFKILPFELDPTVDIIEQYIMNSSRRYIVIRISKN